MPSIAHLITQTPQSNGGAVLRTRSDAPSEDMIFFGIIMSIFFGPPVLLSISLLIMVLVARCGRCMCWGICLDERKACLVDSIYGTPRLIINGFRNIYRLIFVRKTPHQGTAEQQTTPESMEMRDFRMENMRYMRSDPPEGPPGYDNSYPEEPLPVYKQ